MILVVDSAVEYAAFRRAKLAALRDYLLPILLSGHVRVKDAMIRDKGAQHPLMASRRFSS